VNLKLGKKMELDQEELVKLIFGDEEPENWKDNPDFLLYLSELGNIGERHLLLTLLAEFPARTAEKISGKTSVRGS
jgi:hypothetical protein